MITTNVSLNKKILEKIERIQKERESIRTEAVRTETMSEVDREHKKSFRTGILKGESCSCHGSSFRYWLCHSKVAGRDGSSYCFAGYQRT